jgi:diguanylate cyclase (GGDEF)-like protein
VSCTFLVRTDLQGIIEETYWSSPVSLAIPFVTNVCTLFDSPQQAQFNTVFLSAKDGDELVSCNLPLTANANQVLCLYMIHHGAFMWLLALDYVHLLSEEAQEAHRHMVFRMMRYFISLHVNKETQDSQVLYNHFEQIQKLNNELVNTQRKLQRANRQLAVLNEELNNRLVKDPLTNLVSRYQYRSEITRVIEQAPQEVGIFAFIDIDDFKQVNDIHGHAVGDEFLVAFSQRLITLNFDLPTIIMRIAGDEFGIYVHGVKESAEDFATRFWNAMLHQVLVSPIQTRKGSLAIHCCAGLAGYNRDTNNVYELIDLADWAMYQAKRSGKQSCVLFDRSRYNQENTNDQDY